MDAAALLPVAAVSAGIAGAASAWAAVTLLRERRDPQSADKIYEDADGKSTPEAVAAFSNRYAKAALLFTSAASAGTAIAFAVFATIRNVPQTWLISTWLLTAALCALFAHTICIVIVRSSVKSFNLGALALLASLPALAASVTQILLQYDEISHKDDPEFVLRLVNVAVTVLFALATGSLPRRPDVFYEGNIVDAQATVSLWQRLTWGWPKPILDLATKKGDLSKEDIPSPDHTLRVRSLIEKWHSHNFSGKLLWNIFNAARGWFLLQWLLVLFRCFVGLGPFWAMRRLLQKLEQRQPGEAPDSELWALILSLGLLTLLGNWLDGVMMFTGLTRLALPCRAQLSALIYNKSLRRKAVKSAEKKNDSEPATVEAANATAAPPTVITEALADADADPVPETTPLVADGDDHASDDQSLKKNTKDEPSKGSENNEKDSKDEDFQTQQTVVNLLAVDTNRVYSFLFFQYMIISSLFSLFIYSGFLIFLIGWIPFAAGIVFWGLVIPVNTVASKLYMRRTEKLMKIRDEKLAVVNEALLGMRQIKFAALEKQWAARVGAVRDRELSMLWSTFLADVCLISCWIISPIGLAAASLATYVFMYGDLVPSVAFVAIGVFKALELTLGALPEFFESMFESLVSCNRIDKYLQGPELESILTEGTVVAFQNASLAWPVDGEVSEEQRFVLRDVSLTFPAGELSVISGKTGTGKSLLISAILGEVDLLEGSVFVPPTATIDDRHDDTAHPGNWIIPGAIAYVSQTPWLEGASLRDNILFGLPHIETRYQEVLKVCALKKDLEILTDGDRTELGANGINLSGGQKWRVTLARAVYSRAEILVLDDIFSAVDAHVGRQIYDDCLGGELCRGRTRILVTHHVSLVLSRATYLVELGNGTVLDAGSVDQVDENVLQRLKSQEAEEAPVEVPVEAVSSQDEDSSDNQPAVDGEESAKAQPEAGKAYIEEESREKGMVKTEVYARYFRESGSWIAWAIFLLMFLAAEAGSLGQTWWLRIWTGRNEERSVSASSIHTLRPDFQYGLQQPWVLLGHSSQNRTDFATYSQRDNSDVTFYLVIYVVIALVTGLIGVSKFVWMMTISMRASRTLFDQVLFAVLRAPLRWVDTVPIGRILNRLTADFEKVDQRICMMIGYFMGHVLGLVGVCVAAAIVSAYVLPLAALLFFFAFFIAKKYLDGARPIKRLESTSKSPVLELFNASLAGLTTLRAFKKSDDYITRMYGLQDWYDISSAYVWFFNRWMGWRMSILGAFFSALVALVVAADSRIGAALAGFTLTFALEFSSNLIFSIRMYSNLELNMNATERVVEYTLLKTEDQGGDAPPASWPSSGRIEVEDLTVAYAESLPAVLKGISFSVKDNERVGIIGRTGAGKSSLTLALFRFLETRGGTVTIDGLDVSKMDLHSLRSRLAIIPQDPTLFSGTIRENLDPFNDRSDQELHDALASVHLTDGTDTPTAIPMQAVGSSNATLVSTPASSAASTAARPENANIFRDLSSTVAESGGNLSQGQRQLLCLARAIVSRPKIMVLDEATSAVDMATDTMIQRSIREGFSDSTLLVIAHRLTTIADFDRILVLSEGTVAEFDTPRNLWSTEGSIFRDMCEKSGESAKLRSVIFGSSTA